MLYDNLTSFHVTYLFTIFKNHTLNNDECFSVVSVSVKAVKNTCDQRTYLSAVP